MLTNSVDFSASCLCFNLTNKFKLFFTDAEECSKTVNLAIKSESIPKFELSKPALILLKMPKLDLAEKEKSLYCRNSLYSSLKNQVDLQVQDGENVGSHLLCILDYKQNTF